MNSCVEPGEKPLAAYHDWDPRYPEVVRHFIATISPLPSFLTIEHVGSTAIRGCGGKGVIDLLALYQNVHLEDTKTYLMSLGFSSQGPEFARPWPGHRPMLLGYYRYDQERFLMYVHVVHFANNEVRRFRIFRERLAATPHLVRRYCQIKRRIIESGFLDTDVYAVHKREIIHEILGDDYEINKA